MTAETSNTMIILIVSLELVRTKSFRRFKDFILLTIKFGHRSAAEADIVGGVELCDEGDCGRAD